MKKDRIENIFKMFMIMMPVLLIIFTSHSWAYKGDTHKAINQYISDKNSTLNGFSLHTYLQTQLGIQKGVETSFNNKQIFEWIRDGGDSEDNSWRFLNHFYNPLTRPDSGLNVFFWQWNVWQTGKPAIDWALMPISIQGMEGNYSWKDVRYDYYLALINHQGMREFYYGETFRGLGQLMHLVEDMSVPAHTRNDWHPINESYESWALNYVTSPDIVSHYSPFFFQPSDSVTVSNLFDSNQYTGSNPDVTYQANIGLSEFTNANYFSDGTIDSAAFPSPKNDLTQTVTIGGMPYYIKECSNCADTNASRAGRPGYYLLSTVDYSNVWGAYSYDQPIFPILDNYVCGDYARFLMPRAVGYSSQLLNYFFRGKMKVKVLPVFNSDGKLKQAYVKIRNITPTKETMDGPNKSYFVLSYRYTPTGAPSDGSGDKWITSNGIYLPKALPYGLDASGNDLEGDNYEVLIIFDNLDQLSDPIPRECYESVKYILTYIGDLGDENMVIAGGYITKMGTVIGKYIPAKQVLFDEEWIISPKGDNLVWSMSNDSSGNMADSTFCNSFYCSYFAPGKEGRFFYCGDSSCNNPCFDSAGQATDSVDLANGGSLIMNNIRYVFPNCNPSSQDSPAHCNTSLIGYNASGYNYQEGRDILSGNIYNPWNSSANKYIFPIDITKDTYIQISLDEMSISPTPPESNYGLAYQVVEFYFNHGYVLQYSWGDQGIHNSNPYAGYFLLDLGYINVDNIYDLFEQYGLPPPPQDLKLNYIQISQQTLWNLPCDTQYIQKIAVDLIRVGEMTPTY